MSTCEICGREFHSRKGLVQHIRRSHKDVPEVPVQKNVADWYLKMPSGEMILTKRG